jgi:elongation factor P
MVAASQLRPGMAVVFEGQRYKVLSAEYHPGQGKMGGATHTRLRNLSTGTLWEHSFRADLKLEELQLEKRPMEFLYSDDSTCYFMTPATGDQLEVPLSVVGPQASFLSPDLRIAVEFVDDKPVSVQFPDQAEVRIAGTTPPLHGQGENNTWKSATLENGLEVSVPQFIKTGDFIRLDLSTLKYMDRVK